MAFRFVKNININWPVKVPIPQEGGKVDEQTFNVKFKVLTQSEFQSLVDSNPDDLNFFSEFVLGWSDFLDDKGNELEFSRENLAMMIDYTFIRNAIFKAYESARAGIQSKN